MTRFYRWWAKRRIEFVWLTGLLGMVFLTTCHPFAAEPAAEANTPMPPPTATLATGDSATEPISPSISSAPTATPAILPLRQTPIFTADNADAWAAEMSALLAELATRTQGDLAQMLAEIKGWVAPQQLAEGLPWPEHSLAVQADLDDDGAIELLLGVPQLREQCEGETCEMNLVCGAFDCFSAVFFLEPTAVGYTATLFRPDDLFEPWLSNPEFFAHQDLDGDGRSELILAQNWCGASTCGTDLWVGRWDGIAWEPLGHMGQTYTEISLVDENGDGQTEIMLYGGTMGSAGAGLQRPHTLIYGWENGRYTLQKDTPDPNDNPYFLLLDAHAALGNNELGTAYALAENARTNLIPVTPDDDPFSLYDDWGIDRIGAYATIQMMLIEALRGETAVMQTLLAEIETNYTRTDNPYLPAAQALWQIYQTSGDALAACQAMANVLRADPEQAALLSWFGYNMEQIAPEDYCPLSQ